MIGRTPPVKLLSTEQPELPNEVKIQLEADKLFFVDDGNAGRASLTRPYLAGEALPYELHHSATVIVKPHSREFIVFDRQTLVIEEPFEKPKKNKPAHEIIDLKTKLEGQIKMAQEMAERAERNKPRPLTTEERAERKQLERERQAERRASAQHKRDLIRASKRVSKIKKDAYHRREQAEIRLAELIQE